MQYEWVIGNFEGERAKSVLDHAGAGVGYYIRSQSGAGRNVGVEAAFRRACDRPRPEHLKLADQFQVSKLEKMFKERTGVDNAKS